MGVNRQQSSMTQVVANEINRAQEVLHLVLQPQVLPTNVAYAWQVAQDQLAQQVAQELNEDFMRRLAAFIQTRNLSEETARDTAVLAILKLISQILERIIQNAPAAVQSPAERVMAEIERALRAAPTASSSASPTGAPAQEMQHLNQQDRAPTTSLSSSSTPAPVQVAWAEMQQHCSQPNRGPTTSLPFPSTAAPGRGMSRDAAPQSAGQSCSW